MNGAWKQGVVADIWIWDTQEVPGGQRGASRRTLPDPRYPSAKWEHSTKFCLPEKDNTTLERQARAKDIIKMDTEETRCVGGWATVMCISTDWLLCRRQCTSDTRRPSFEVVKPYFIWQLQFLIPQLLHRAPRAVRSVGYVSTINGTRKWPPIVVQQKNDPISTSWSTIIFL